LLIACSKKEVALAELLPVLMVKIRTKSSLKALCNQIAMPKYAAVNVLKDAKTEFDNFAKAMKTDGQSYYRAIRGHWKAEGKGIAATQ
jgi:hypothetical protein